MYYKSFLSPLTATRLSMGPPHSPQDYTLASPHDTNHRSIQQLLHYPHQQIVIHILDSSYSTASTNHKHNGSMAPPVPSWEKVSCKHTHERVPQARYHHKIPHTLHLRLPSKQTTQLNKQISPPLHGSPPKPLAQVQPNKLSSLALLQHTLKCSSYYYYTCTKEKM